VKGDTFEMPRDMWYERKGNTCVVKFMHAPHRTEWILGVNFFQNYYAVMDYEHKRLGLAKSIKYGKPGSRQFINWALSEEFLNLIQKVDIRGMEFKDQVLVVSSGLAFTFFIIYYLIISRR